MISFGDIQIEKALFTDMNGNTYEGNAEIIKNIFTDRNGGIRFVNAGCEEGFSPDSALLLVSDEKPSRWLAIENHSKFWCRPAWGEDFSDIPDRVQEILLYDGEKYRAIVPLCGNDFKTVICGYGGKLAFRVYSNYPSKLCDHEPIFIFRDGIDPWKLLSDIASDISRCFGIRLRNERNVNEIFDHLGWCSWDAFQIRVNSEGLIDKVREFRDKNVPVRFSIIDDMWADVPKLSEIPENCSFGEMVGYMHGSKMRSFEGDPVRFPGGMEQTVVRLKLEGMKYVGIWFPTTGYWSGLEKDGAIYNEEYPNLAENALGQFTVSPEKEKAAAYFDDLCRKAYRFGADFVKIDNQGFHDRYRGISTIGKSAGAVQEAIDSAAEKYFGGALINCMGMPNECMFKRPTSAVCRCSDDFKPESREWFAKNILQCAYNGLFQGKFYVNDWDMWWTDDEQATKNSLCRAISGGPVYISDKLGRTRKEILAPLCLSDGLIFRPDESAAPCADCLMENPTKSGKIFKIRNTLGHAGLVAAFNIDSGNREVSGYVSSADAGLDENCRYAYREYFTGDVGILEPGQKIKLTLCNNDEFRLYTFVKMNGFAALFGRLDLYTGVGVVKSVTADENEPDTYTVRLEEGGEIGFVSENDFDVTDHNGDPIEVVCDGILRKINTDRFVKELIFIKK